MKTYRAEQEVLPLLLQNGGIPEAWKEWCLDRRERKKIITERAAKMQIGTLIDIVVEHGPAMTAAHLRYSIELGRTGIFPPSDRELSNLRRRVKTVSTNGGSLVSEKQKASDRVWELWNALEITNEQRHEAIRKIEGAKSIEEVKAVVLGVKPR